MERNVFAQILMAQKITNDNVVALNDNLTILREKIEAIEKILNYSEPVAIGTDNTKTIDGANINI